MAKYKATIRYAGEITVEVEADNQRDAELLAQIEFDNVSAVEIEAGLLEIDTCDCWEVDECEE